MKIDFTYETIFGFEGPNLSLLGNENDFLLFAKAIVDLTGIEGREIEINALQFVKSENLNNRIFFKRITGSNKLGYIDNNGNLRFELDKVYWDRIFRYLILMSWEQSTYYLNAEDCFNDFQLEQECNFICSSEY
jgi:hypothetical protein